MLVKRFAINSLLSKTEQQPIISVQAEIKHEVFEDLPKSIDDLSQV